MSTRAPEPDSPEEAQRRELLRLWQDEGRAEALDNLLQSEITFLKSMLKRRGGSLLRTSLGATDVAHDAVLGLLSVEKPPDFDSPRALRSYLWTSAWRLLMQRLARRKQKPLRFDETRGRQIERVLATTGGASRVLDSDRAAALQVAMNLLKAEDREILDLVYFRELDLAAAAAQLGIAKDAANMRLVRARRRLADKLSDWAALVG